MVEDAVGYDDDDWVLTVDVVCDAGDAYVLMVAQPVVEADVQLLFVKQI